MNGEDLTTGYACDRCGARNTTLKREATFLFCHDRAGCDAQRREDNPRTEDVIAPVDGYPDVRIHGPRDQVNAILNLITAQEQKR
jgi:hypothetical protein